MKKNIIYLISIIGILIFASCKKDDAGSGTKAVFSYVADGYKVNFTNFSTNASEFSWDFGDGSKETSTQKSPQHIFKSKGNFLVSLTAKSGSETSTFIDTVFVAGPNIKIDGDFTDWEFVSYTHENAAGAGGTLLAAKTFASSTDIFFYVEGTPAMEMALIDLFIDGDNNPATGFFVGAYPTGSGADFLAEGPATKDSWGEIFKHSGAPSAFSFTPVSAFTTAMNFSVIKPVSGKNVIEFSIKKSALGAPKNAINFLLFDLSSGYATLGSLPASNTGQKFIAVPL